MQTEFAQRRVALLATIPWNTVVILANAPSALRNGSIHYPYRARSHFYYLTGFQEPESILLLQKSQSGNQFILFNRTKDDPIAQWSGKPAGQQEACSRYGADQSYPISEFKARLPNYLAQCESICFLMHEDRYIQKHLNQLLTYSDSYSTPFFPKQWIDLAYYLNPLRAIKGSEEITYLRQAAKISSQAQKRVMQYCKPNLYEYEIEAELLHEFHKQGSQSQAYESIVASGKNACILHYPHKKTLLRNGDLLLVDAGCEYQYYAADITRTFPINGHFTNSQRKLYEIVLQAQIAAIEAIKPGISWAELENITCTILTKGLSRLGLLIGEPPLLLESQAIRSFYPHRIGHALGLDVHDVTPRDETILQPNMVITIEPGIYIHSKMSHIAPEWHNIGIRIEDEILVTETGVEVLSADAPKTIEEIEQAMQT